MEGGKQSGSSFASDLFGAKDSSAAASSSGIFGSIFPPPPKITGLWVVKAKARTQQARSLVHIFRRKRCSHFITARRSTMVVKTSILDPRVPRTLGSP
ncbi:UNVERIFIED_CONTAM: hypothetical protein Sangu_1347800, partial [Sesamum angustifolium]